MKMQYTRQAVSSQAQFAPLINFLEQIDSSEAKCDAGSMGKHLNTILFLTTAAILIWLWTHRPSVAPPVRPPPRPAPKVAQTPAMTAPAPTPEDEDEAELKPVAASEQTDPHTPPKGTIPFELWNGYVVAYGDIILGKPTTADFPQTGFIEAPKLHLWDKGVIPFSVHNALPNPERVLSVIAYLNENTPLHFVPYEGQPDSIVFFPMDGLCLSYLGKTGGNQPIYLDFRCSEHEILHEVLHAIGFIHEQSRADRDQYVRINWNNIEPDKADQFDIAPPWLSDPLKNRPFDFKSVMLYPSTAFARDRGQPTILPIGDQTIEPTANGLSVEDLERVRLLYGPH
jgi:hypothetical protein